MQSLYQQALGAAFSQLDPVLQRFHRESGVPWQGRAQVQWSANPLVRALLRLGRFPVQGVDQPALVELSICGSKEVWRRDFAGTRMESMQSLDAGHIQERIGPIALALDTRVSQNGLTQTANGSTLLGLRLPAPFGLQVQAREWANQERLHFEVEIRLGAALLLNYCGWLAPLELEAVK